MAVGSEGNAALRSYVVVGKETVYGTYASATTAIEALSCNFRTDIDSEKIDAIGMNRGFLRRVTLNKVVKGSLEQYLHPIDSPLLWISGMGGTCTSAALSGSSYTHSVSIGNFDTSQSLGLSFNVRKGPSMVFRYVGGRVNQIKLSAKAGEIVKCSYDIVFKDSTQLSDDIGATLSISSVLPFTYAQGDFRYAETEAKADTTTASEPIQSFELSINNNLVTDANARAFGSNLLSILPPGRRDVKLKVSQRFDTTTTWQRFIQATQGSVQLTFTGALVNASTSTYQMYIRLPKVYNNTGDTELSNPKEILSADIEYDVVLDNTGTTVTSKDIGVTFINGVASY
jgi:hypothetical protein